MVRQTALRRAESIERISLYCNYLLTLTLFGRRMKKMKADEQIQLNGRE